MGLKLLMGSKFDNDFKESDRGKTIIVNEKLVKDYAWKDNPIGKKLKMNDTVYLNVVGVVKDFYPNGFWTKIDAMAFRLGEKEMMRFLIVRADEKDLSQLDKDLRNLWSKILPNEVYGGVYQEQLSSGAKEVNSQIVKIFNFLAIVSILLSLVGLYTLVSLTIIKKTKEMGIRKVLGAPYRSLVKLIYRDYMIILFIASVLGGYLGCFASGTLMKSIWKYYMNISFTSILIPISLILTISIIAIFRKVYISTNQNPVDSLKYE